MTDYISRQAALDALKWEWVRKATFDVIKNLPSAQPEPKKGKWINAPSPSLWGDMASHCSECGSIAIRRSDDEDSEILTNFCPNCGADMRGEKE